MNNLSDYVRLCPVCDTENSPERAHCQQCGSLLADVDFSRPRGPADELAETVGAVAQVAAVRPPDAVPAGAGVPASPVPPAAGPLAAPLFGEPAGPLTCPDPDCGQINPPGSDRCLYCNTLLQPAGDLAAAAAAPPASTAGTLLEPANPDWDAPTLRLEPVRADLPRGETFVEAHARVNLPADLAARYQIVSELKAAGSEADLLVVEPLAGGEPLVLKLYRRGIRPDPGLLERLAAAGEHVVRIYEHGVSDGLAWELMEYCRAGSLREVLRRGLLTRDFLRQLVAQLAAGIAEVHARRILHRDLKPENILIRSRDPLHLVLTDFGIASLTEATQHFTDGARTVKYAAPEALTGVIDPKADWWSVGMILLEAVAGRHPFEGLSEQVINHHLATRPVAVDGVVDEDFARLCRGLLLRDPLRRWGAPEVQRWLAGDASLAAPVESGATAVRPYRIGGQEARSGEELALALAAHWDAGRQDLMRGLVREWVRGELHDFELTRRLADIMESRDESEDRRLLRFLLAAAPALPPVWLGRSADRGAILAQARLAVGEGEGAGAARRWLDGLFEQGVPALFGGAGQADMADLEQHWQADLAAARSAWEQARQAGQAWKRRPRPVGGSDSARVVDFDAMVYGRDAEFAFGKPVDWHGPLLLARADAAYRDALAKEVELARPALAEDCPWFAELSTGLGQDVAAIVVAFRLLGLAREQAAAEQRNRQAAIAARGQAVLDLRQEVAHTVAPLLMPWDEPDRFARQEINRGLEALFGLANRIAAMSHPEEAFLLLQRQVASLQRLGFALGQALDGVEQAESTNAIFFTGNRLELALAIPFAVALLASLWVGVLIGVGGGGFLFWRWRQLRRARQALGLQLQLFQRQAAQMARPGRN